MKTETKTSRADVVKRYIAPVAIWAVNRALDNPRMRDKSATFEKRAQQTKKNAVRSIRKAARNAASNRGWFAAGAAAFAIGIGLMAKASRSR